MSKGKIDDKNAIPHAGKPAKLVPLVHKLLNITDPDVLMAELDKLTDKQFAQYEKCIEKKMMFSTRHKFSYIHWYHRLFLWMFRTRQSIDDYKGFSSSVYYKVVFGNYFLVDEKANR